MAQQLLQKLMDVSCSLIMFSKGNICYKTHNKGLEDYMRQKTMAYK